MAGPAGDSGAGSGREASNLELGPLKIHFPTKQQHELFLDGLTFGIELEAGDFSRLAGAMQQFGIKEPLSMKSTRAAVGHLEGLLRRSDLVPIDRGPDFAASGRAELGLDLYSRCLCGQLECLTRHWRNWWAGRWQGPPRRFAYLMDSMGAHVAALKYTFLDLPEFGSFGITSELVPNDARLLWDMLRTLRGEEPEDLGGAPPIEIWRG